MFRQAIGLSLVLSLPSTGVCQQIADEPYLALFRLDVANYPPSELKFLRSDLQEQRKSLLDECKKEEERLEEEIERARRQLKDLNKDASSQEAGQVEGTRTALHKIIEAAEDPLRKTRVECERNVSATFETKLTKLRVSEDWPDRREEILRAMDTGHVRQRKFGDVEDIGYRRFFDGQEKDIPAGEQAIRQMKFGGVISEPLQDAAVQEYVRRLSTKLASNSDLKVPLHTTVIGSPEINAIALPGGFLFVTTGLLAAAANESELAGALSHEIAHIAARHGTRTSRRSRVSTIFMQSARVATGLFTGGIGSTEALYGINLGFQSLDALVDRTILSAQGKYEKEADQLGLQYAWKAGFDPKGFVNLLDSILQQDHSKTAGFFRTHPHTDERILDVFSEIQLLPENSAATADSIEFHQIKERIREGSNSGTGA